MESPTTGRFITDEDLERAEKLLRRVRLAKQHGLLIRELLEDTDAKFVGVHLVEKLDKWEASALQGGART